MLEQLTRPLKRMSMRIVPSPMQPVMVHLMDQNFEHSSEAIDISITGIAVKAPIEFEAIQLKTEIQLIIRLPSWRPFFVLGVTRHLYSTQSLSKIIGVEFIHINDCDSKQVGLYIKSREPKAPEILESQEFGNFVPLPIAK